MSILSLELDLVFVYFSMQAASTIILTTFSLFVLSHHA